MSDKNIFIYRAGVSGNGRSFPLYDELIKEFGEESIFMATNVERALNYFDHKLSDIIDLRTLWQSNNTYIYAQRYRPIDATQIEDMADSLHLCLEIIGRDKKNEDYLARVNYYYDYLCFWLGYLDNHRINIFLSEGIPHEFHGLMLYFLCKKKGIQTILWGESITDYGYFTRDIFSSIDQRVFETPVDIAAKSKLNRDFYSVLTNYMNMSEDITPYYNTKEATKKFEREMRRSMPKVAKRIVYALLYSFQTVFRTKNQLIINKLFNYSRYNDPINISGGAIAYYESIAQKNCDFKKKYFYVPLHYQPELTTVPMAGIYENHLLWIRMLSSIIPDDCFLYVKEHLGQFLDPRSFPGHRDVRYYEELCSIKKVVLIDTSVDTYELLNHCIAVATATGTAGLEGLFRNKQVIIFGGRFYQYAPGAYRVKTYDECRKAIKKIMSNYQTFMTDEVLMADFLLRIQKISFFKGIVAGVPAQDIRWRNCGDDEKMYAYELLMDMIES